MATIREFRALADRSGAEILGGNFCSARYQKIACTFAPRNFADIRFESSRFMLANSLKLQKYYPGKS